MSRIQVQRNKKQKRSPGRAVRSSRSIEKWYQDQLLSLTKAMHKSIFYWLTAEYRKNYVGIVKDSKKSYAWTVFLGVFDASPARNLERELRKRGRQWTKKFNQSAEKLAKSLAARTNTYTKTQIRTVLRELGYTIDFTTTRDFKNILDSVIAENVGLIKSIAEQDLHKVEVIAQQAIRAGRDIYQFQTDLQREFGISERRAINIAKDQCNKVSEDLSTQRYIDVGLEEFEWVHYSAGSKTFRHTHVQASGKRFKLTGPEKGFYDSMVKRRVMPGELPYCKCGKKPIPPELKESEE